MPRYFVGTVCKEHAMRGVQGGFAQLCHGKEGPLKRMAKGDFLVYYSPGLVMGGSATCQAFTALGKVRGDACYRAQMAPDFVPFRRDVDYAQGAKEAPIRPLIPRLEFLRDRGAKWGSAFRFGQFEISKHDFDAIASAMDVRHFVEGDVAAAAVAEGAAGAAKGKELGEPEPAAAAPRRKAKAVAEAGPALAPASPKRRRVSASA